jgi:hypothetical protein
MYCYSDKNMKLNRKFVQDFNGRRVPDEENVTRSFCERLMYGKLKPASLEIDLVRPRRLVPSGWSGVGQGFFFLRMVPRPALRASGALL